jgi:hypothetical protein
LDQAGAPHAAGHGYWLGDFVPLEIGPLLNIDHNAQFNIYASLVQSRGL